MVFTAYSCEQIYMKRINVAGDGLSNGNDYAVIEILYNDKQMEEVDGVWYKEFGKNPISKRIVSCNIYFYARNSINTS